MAIQNHKTLITKFLERSLLSRCCMLKPTISESCVEKESILFVKNDHIRAFGPRISLLD